MLSRTLDLVKTLQNELSSEKLEKTIDTLRTKMNGIRKY